jgi:hypothetical protein
LHEAVQRDPVVAAHYSEIALHRVRREQVNVPRLAYMSYRIGDRVYWTQHKVPLRAGETILTDGDTTIRARCGNLISDVAMTPTSPDEPPVEEFDRGWEPHSGTWIVNGPGSVAHDDPVVSSSRAAEGPAPSGGGPLWLVGPVLALRTGADPETHDPIAGAGSEASGQQEDALAGDESDEPHPGTPGSTDMWDTPEEGIGSRIIEDPEQPPVTVPDPGTIVLFGLGAAAVGCRRLIDRRRRTRHMRG